MRLARRAGDPRGVLLADLIMRGGAYSRAVEQTAKEAASFVPEMWRREVQFARWAGQLSDVRQALDQAVDAIRPWLDREPPVDVDITTRDGSVTGGRGVLDHGVSDGELPGVRSIRIAVGRYPKALVEIRASRYEPAMFVGSLRGKIGRASRARSRSSDRL